MSFFFLPEAKEFLEFFPNSPVTVSTFCKAITCTVSQAVLKHASITGKDKSRVELIFK